MRMISSVLTVLLLTFLGQSQAQAQHGGGSGAEEGRVRDTRVYLQAPMRPDDPRVARIKTALDALPGISNSSNVYGNRITLTRVPGQTVTLDGAPRRGRIHRPRPIEISHVGPMGPEAQGL